MHLVPEVFFVEHFVEGAKHGAIDDPFVSSGNVTLDELFLVV